MNRKRLQSILADADSSTYAATSAPQLSDAMNAKLRRFHHACCEVSGTYVSRRQAMHILLDEGMRGLGNDVIKAARGKA